MSGSTTSSWRRGQRVLDRVSETIGAQPLGVLVFFASILLLAYLQADLGGSIRAQAVASAPQVDHPARVSSFVTSVYVKPGDIVEPGSPLVELSPHFIERELARVDTEIEKLIRESQLAQARLIVEEQRWLNPDLRMACLLYTSPSPRDATLSRMPSSA